MNAYYNEIDPYCCAWLSNLMDAGLITPGRIDDRSIADVSPDDVRGYERCHFFAGIAGWELALSLSGYAGPVWTGSCPCQPFSAAGKGKASSDERHLWPEWFRLIRAVRPAVVFGEQVEAAIGWGWLDLVHSDLEPEGYTIRSAVLPACSVGAPHIRQRLWFVANADSERLNGQRLQLSERQSRQAVLKAAGASETSELADANGGHPGTEGLQRGGEHGQREEDGRADAVAHANGPRCGQGRAREASERSDETWQQSSGFCSAGPSVTSGRETPFKSDRVSTFAADASDAGNWMSCGRTTGANPWSDLLWLPCTDGKSRPTQPGIFPLAHGVPARVAKLRAAGNAITPQCAAEFIKASSPTPRGGP